MIPLSLLAIAIFPYALAAPQPVSHADPIHLPVFQKHTNPQERVANLPKIVDAIRTKYGYQPVMERKRSTTNSPITDEQNDASYSAVVDIGTPAQQFNLILDTGSSDLWVVDTQCDDCDFSQSPAFDPTQSSSYKNLSSSLQIAYGSGQVEGFVSQENVGFAGFNISQQQFLAVTDTSTGLLSQGLSGIMGLGFQTISALETTPFWQTLFNKSQLSSPTFAFYLERYVTDSQQINAAPGGTFTLGGTNSSLYQGQIEFINMPSGQTPSYWLQQVQSVTVQGKTISIPSSQGLAAIDTGTTLIGAPSGIAKQIWASVPGSVALSGANEGQFAFPCSTAVSVSISFGGTNWEISTADMNIGQIDTGSGSTSMCAGGIFDVGASVGDSTGTPAWIVGDTFLKNVYSVYQANPPAVGFAQLANGLNNTSSTPSGTTPGTSSGGTSSSGALPSFLLSMTTTLVALLLASFFVTL